MAKWTGAGPVIAAMVCGAAAAGAAQAQVKESRAVPAPAPVISTLAVPPYYSSSRPARLKPVLVTVEVAGEADILYKGDLRIGDTAASYNSSVNEAFEACPADGTGVPRFSNATSSVRVSVSRRERDAKAGERFNVSVNWVRPGPPCEGGVSTVGFDRTVSLDPGKTATLAGDAGLTVRVTRGQ